MEAQLTAARVEAAIRIEAGIKELDPQHRKLIKRAADRFGGFDNVPQHVWDKIAQDIRESLEAAILLLMLRADEETTDELHRQGVMGEFPDESAYLDAANELVDRVGKQIADTVRDTIRDKSTGYVSPSQYPEGFEDDLLDSIFTPARRARIAMTTSVNASSAGQMGAARRVVSDNLSGAPIMGYGRRLDDVEMLWMTTLRDNVCQLCAPLHNQTEDVWGLVFPSGPGDAAHPNCACWLVPRAIITEY